MAKTFTVSLHLSNELGIKISTPKTTSTSSFAWALYKNLNPETTSTSSFARALHTNLNPETTSMSSFA
jgi:hypothetical protein